MALVATACALGVAAGSACCGTRLVVRDHGPLAALADQRASVTVELTVRDDPRQVGPASPAATTYAVPASLVAVAYAGRVTTAGDTLLVLATDQSWRGLLPGQRVRAEGRLAPPRGGDLTAAVLSAKGAPTLVGRPPWLQRAAGSLRAGLQRACVGLPAEQGGLLPGLVVGDTSRLDSGVEEAFRSTGMTHLTAVSGANLAIVAGLVLFLTRWCRAGPVASAVLAAVAVAGFVVLARPSPSVVRAAAMCGLGLLALALGRPRAAVPALAGSVLVLVLFDPALAGAAGFALSVAATAGLLLVAPGWATALRRRRVPAGLAEALAVPAAAQAACAPLLAAMTGTVSLSAVPANLLAAMAVAPATILGVLAAVASVIAPPLAEMLAWLGSWPAWWLVTVAHAGAEVPSGLAPWPGGAAGGWLLAAALLGVASVARFRAARRVLLAVLAAVVLVALPLRVVAPGWPAAGWLLVACDVGQGDAFVLRAGPSAAVVVDAGPDPALVDGCLSRLGVEKVPLMIVSHLHADHVGGLAGVLRGRRIGAIGLGPFTEPAAGRARVEEAARARGVPFAALTAGQHYELGETRLRVLAPTTLFHGTRSDPNNNSLVVRAEVAGVSILLSGDVEHEAERALLGSGEALAVDVLKVPHHGSAQCERLFLDATRPRVALVGVGAGNGYGHPNAGVLTHLRRNGARVLRTDQEGDIAVVRGPGGLATVARGVQTTATRR